MVFATGSQRLARNHSRTGSWGQRLASAIGSIRHESMGDSKASLNPDDRVWYDQFTSTDWVHDSIADAYRIKALRSRKDIRGRIKAVFDGTQGWILSALVGFITATIAYVVNVSEAPVFDWKDGYCSDGWFISEKVRAAPCLFPPNVSSSSPERSNMSGSGVSWPADFIRVSLAMYAEFYKFSQIFLTREFSFSHAHLCSE